MWFWCFLIIISSLVVYRSYVSTVRWKTQLPCVVFEVRLKNEFEFVLLSVAHRCVTVTSLTPATYLLSLRLYLSYPIIHFCDYTFAVNRHVLVSTFIRHSRCRLWNDQSQGRPRPKPLALSLASGSSRWEKYFMYEFTLSLITTGYSSQGPMFSIFCTLNFKYSEDVINVIRVEYCWDSLYLTSYTLFSYSNKL